MTNNTVKIRKSGNSNILTLPKEIKPKAKKYRVFQGRDGMIVYVPEKSNPFKNQAFIDKYKNSRQKEEFEGSLFDNELS
ncbi:hypothetical protein [Lactobacillus acetotolerans]|jgi:virulence-associated protein VagC|uniref:Uncharacterized protein n=1 Tax=Lactobacillus acetotolerans TaxID=1600 RepID=A0A0D6A1I5_9LACO|nr:hypothetical protein [Lactobacillus acetotolerans]QGV05129.1 antitoxin of toxin-antitoxin stability system [Lactobacillus acetotolerans]BAQ56616.1 conserved hypothetical protein [Lactobacillus acetotolerans]